MSNKKRIKMTRADIIFEVINHIFIFLILALCVYPLYYTVICSFSDPMLVTSGKILFYIKGFTLDSYKTVFKYHALWVGYGNTIFYTVVGTAYNLLLLLPASYALSRKELKGKGFFMLFFVFTMYFGGGMIPTYINIRNLKLLNTRLVMIINGAFVVYNMIITRTFFASTSQMKLWKPPELTAPGKSASSSSWRFPCPPLSSPL